MLGKYQFNSSDTCLKLKISYLRKIMGLILKVRPCKICNNKYLITSTQIANIEIFTSISVLLLKLVSRKFLFTHKKKTTETVKK